MLAEKMEYLDKVRLYRKYFYTYNEKDRLISG
jgi:hypothetical protein